MKKAFLENEIHHARVVNRGDVVPHVPPEPWFSHAGDRHLLDQQQVEHNEGAWNSFKAEIAGWFSKVKSTIKVADLHRLTTKVGYIPRLRKELP